MQVLYERCCGLDVHKKTVVACVLITSPDGQVQKQGRTFATTTASLLALADWLASLDISHVALESTGIYWRPVFNLLEEGRTIILVHAQHMRAVPGHKTDIKDSEWLADLLRHGLLKARFIPSKPTRDLRDLVRYRKTLVQERSEGGSIACKKSWRRPTSSSLQSPPMCWARADATCSRPCFRAKVLPTPWPSWPADACGPSCRSCVRPWKAASMPPTASCCATCWTTSSFSKANWRSSSRKSRPCSIPMCDLPNVLATSFFRDKIPLRKTIPASFLKEIWSR